MRSSAAILAIPRMIEFYCGQGCGEQIVLKSSVPGFDPMKQPQSRYSCADRQDRGCGSQRLSGSRPGECWQCERLTLLVLFGQVPACRALVGMRPWEPGRPGGAGAGKRGSYAGMIPIENVLFS